jgi:ATP-dependent Clp protease adaptor protein ClpS
MAETNPPAPAEQTGGTTTAEPAKPAPKAAAKAAARPRVEKLPPYNVVLLDDDHHTYAYVIEMLVALFGHDPQKAFKMAQEVDSKGRVIVLTTHKEKAELKRDQITAYGADARMASSQGSMSAVIEPAME